MAHLRCDIVRVGSGGHALQISSRKIDTCRVFRLSAPSLRAASNVGYGRIYDHNLNTSAAAVGRDTEPRE